jgi:hypothetical protein
MSDYTTHRVVSKDGTSIGYRQYGQGPGLVLVQGAMGTAEEFSELAAAGRATSPLPWNEAHSIERDVEDVAALIATTGARDAFGLSSGAIIVLTAAARGVPLARIAAFEPPLFTAGLPAHQIDRFWCAISQHDAAPALTAAGKAVQLVPAVRYIPAWLMTLLVRRALRTDAALAEIAFSLPYDIRIVAEMHGRLDAWHALGSRVLLLGGSESPDYLKRDLGALQAVLPNASRVTLPGLDHGASWNPHPQRNRRGDPQAVAIELRRFFESARSSPGR